MTDEQRREEAERQSQQAFRRAMRKGNYDTQVRQPYLSWMRRLLRIPEPHITYAEAVEIAYAFNSDARQTPLIVKSHLRDYQVEVATWTRGGHNHWKIDMADGHIHELFLDYR